MTGTQSALLTFRFMCLDMWWQNATQDTTQTAADTDNLGSDQTYSQPYSDPCTAQSLTIPGSMFAVVWPFDFATRYAHVTSAPTGTLSAS